MSSILSRILSFCDPSSKYDKAFVENSRIVSTTQETPTVDPSSVVAPSTIFTTDAASDDVSLSYDFNIRPSPGFLDDVRGLFFLTSLRHVLQLNKSWIDTVLAGLLHNATITVNVRWLPEGQGLEAEVTARGRGTSRCDINEHIRRGFLRPGPGTLRAIPARLVREEEPDIDMTINRALAQRWGGDGDGIAVDAVSLICYGLNPEGQARLARDRAASVLG